MKPVEAVTPGAKDLPQRNAWPGNVRELENVIRGAAILCNGLQVSGEDLPPRLRHPSAKSRMRGALPNASPSSNGRRSPRPFAEKGHSRTRAATRLGITRKMLLAKIAAYRLESVPARASPTPVKSVQNTCSTFAISNTFSERPPGGRESE